MRWKDKTEEKIAANRAERAAVEKRLTAWHPHFAWNIVSDGGNNYWLTWVERKMSEYKHYEDSRGVNRRYRAAYFRKIHKPKKKWWTPLTWEAVVTVYLDRGFLKELNVFVEFDVVDNEYYIRGTGAPTIELLDVITDEIGSRCYFELKLNNGFSYVWPSHTPRDGAPYIRVPSNTAINHLHCNL